MNLSRRQFCALMGACFAGVAAGSLAWDIGVNGGRPAEESGDEDEPPQ